MLHLAFLLACSYDEPAETVTTEATGCVDESSCCAVCRSGKACGDACISEGSECSAGEGCACDASEVCAE